MLSYNSPYLLILYNTLLDSLHTVNVRIICFYNGQGERVERGERGEGGNREIGERGEKIDEVVYTDMITESCIK